MTSVFSPSFRCDSTTSLRASYALLRFNWPWKPFHTASYKTMRTIRKATPDWNGYLREMKRYLLENSSFAGNWKTRLEKLCVLLKQRVMKSLERGRLNDARNGQKNGRRERTSSIRRHGIFTIAFTAWDGTKGPVGSTARPLPKIPGSLEDIFQNILDLGRLTGRLAEAEAIVTERRARLKKISNILHQFSPSPHQKEERAGVRRLFVSN